MADDLGESFRSFSNSSSSFRILNPASELPAQSRTISAPSLSDSHDWDHSASTYNRSPEHSIGGDSYEGLRSRTTSAAGRVVRPSSSSATVRSASTKPTPHASGIQVPSVGPNSNYVAAPKHSRVMKREVWRDIVLKSDGRDKAFKLIQYSIRVYLWFHSKAVPAHLGADLNRRLKATMSGLSLVRKCLILFNWLTPLIEITNPPPLPFASSSSNSLVDSFSSGCMPKRSLLHRLIHASPPTLIDLFNSLADDTFTFHRLGLVPSYIGNKADRLANWLWFLSTLAGLVEVETDAAAVQALVSELDNRIYDVELDPKTVGRGGAKKNAPIGLTPTGQPNKVDLSVGVEEATDGLQKLRKQSRELRITRWKLIMDLIFVSYDVFRVKRFREPALAFSGLASAILSSWKIYDKHHLAVARARLLDEAA